MNKRIIILCFMLVLAAIIASSSPARAQTSDILSGYGLQLSYKIVGADLGPPSDTTTSNNGVETLQRTYAGTLSGSVLSVTGTFGATGSTITGAQAFASVGSEQDEYTYSTGDSSFGVTVPIPNPIPPEGGQFSVLISGVSGQLEVVGSFAAGPTTTTTTSASPCDTSDLNSYTQDGWQYKVEFTSLQADKPAYVPASTVVVWGTLDLKQRGVFTNKNCPEPYPSALGAWEDGDASKVTIALFFASRELPRTSVDPNGYFTTQFVLDPDAALGDHSLTVTATGPPGSDRTPTTATQTLTVRVQPPGQLPGPSAKTMPWGSIVIGTAIVAGAILGAAVIVSLGTIEAVGTGIGIIDAIIESPAAIRVGLWLASAPGVRTIVGVIYGGLNRATTVGVPLLKAGYDGVVKGVVEPIEDGRFARWYEKPHGP